MKKRYVDALIATRLVVQIIAKAIGEVLCLNNYKEWKENWTSLWKWIRRCNVSLEKARVDILIKITILLVKTSIVVTLCCDGCLTK